MIGFLRFVGIVNAAVWFGAAIFFTFFAAPGFFSDEMLRILPPPYNGAAAQLIIKRYFILQQWCGAIALLHLFAEKLYAGRALERFTLAVLLVLFSLGLAGGVWLQPKLRDLYLVKYNQKATPEQREVAARTFKTWHGVSQSANLLILPGLLFYLWRVTSSSNGTKLSSFRKLSVGWQ